MAGNIAIPNTDLVLSPIGFGTVLVGEARIGERELFPMLDQYLEQGGNVIDTARLYGGGRSEGVIGRWLSYSGRRSEVVLISKGGHPHLEQMHQGRMSQKDMEQDLTTSLRELGTDHIDIYFYHRDSAQPVEESIEIMESFVKRGMIRYYACSNWTTKRIQAAMEYSQAQGYRGFVANQMFFNMGTKYMSTYPDDTLVIMDDEMEAYHREHQEVLAMPYFSVCSGFFHRGLRDGFEAAGQVPYNTPENRKVAAQISALCEKYQASVSQVLLGFFRTRGYPMVPLYGATSPQRLEDALGTLKIPFAAEDFQI